VEGMSRVDSNHLIEKMAGQVNHHRQLRDPAQVRKEKPHRVGQQS